MFTGLIETTGRLLEKRSLAGSEDWVIEFQKFRSPLEIGESIAVDGCCLTVTETKNNTCRFQLSAETLTRTSLGSAEVGEDFHLERACQVGSRLGGHLVQGHVDQTGVIRSIEAQGECTRLTVNYPKELGKYLIQKGSITLSGVSLTLNEIERDEAVFSVMIVPHTWEICLFSQYKPGRRVNLEVDLIAKYVENMLRQRNDDHANIPRP